MTADSPSTPSHAAEQQADPWRKHRIWAGVLTVFLGLVLAIFWLAFGQQMSFVSGVMSGRGPSEMSVPFPLVAMNLGIVIGGLMFCGTKGWGRTMVWLAAVITPLVVIMGSNFGLFALIIIAISAYLIWVLRKTKPARKGLRLAASRLAVGLVIVLLMMIVLLPWIGEPLVTYSAKKYWKPTEHLVGVRIGMSRENVFSRIGNPDGCAGGECYWFPTSSREPDLVVKFDQDHVSSVVLTNPSKLGHTIPFETVEQMREILGEEDISARLNGYTKHTYQDWKVTYEFTLGYLAGVSIGEHWGHCPNGDYFIEGSHICPGEECPWDDEGDLKKGYE